MFCENRGRMTRRKSICVVKICTPREVHEGVMRGHAANVLPPMDILCGVLQGGSAGVANEPGILKRESVVTLIKR